MAGRVWMEYGVNSLNCQGGDNDGLSAELDASRLESSSAGQIFGSAQAPSGCLAATPYAWFACTLHEM